MASMNRDVGQSSRALRDESSDDTEEIPLVRHSRRSVSVDPVGEVGRATSSVGGLRGEGGITEETASLRTVAGVERSEASGSKSFDPNVHYGDVAMYPRCNLRSSITDAVTLRFLDDFHFPANYGIRVPRSDERIYHRPDGVWIGISRWAFRCGLRFPLHSFYADVLNVLGISLGQLCPNAFTQVCGYLAMCKRRAIEPRRDYFWYTYNVAASKERGFYTFGRKAGRPKWVAYNSNNKEWAREWLYVGGPNLIDLPAWGPLCNDYVEEVPSLKGGDLTAYNKFARLSGDETRWTMADIRQQSWLEANGCLGPKPTIVEVAEGDSPAPTTQPAGPAVTPAAAPAVAESEAAFLARAAARRAGKRKVTDGKAPKPTVRTGGKLVIRDSSAKEPLPVDTEVKRKANEPEEEPSAKKAKGESPDDPWHPAWDLRKGDSLFGPNDGGRFVNMEPFQAFLLPRDRDRLAKADLEESFGASMGHMSRALAYFASGSSMLSEFLHQYRQMEEATEKSNKLAKDAFEQRDIVQKEYNALDEERKALKEENEELKLKIS